MGIPGSYDDPLFPFEIPFRKPTAQEWLNDFAALREWVQSLESASKETTASGYSMKLKETAHQKWGRLRIPVLISFDTLDDLAACAGELASLQRFTQLHRFVQEREPRLLAWLAQRPMSALEHHAIVPQLLAVTAYLGENPRSKRFPRELGISGVDGKFIEQHARLLDEWLQLLLPQGAFDPTVRGTAQHAFERRYGLRFEEPSMRFRWLDPNRALEQALTDVTTPLTQFVAWAPTCRNVIVTENKVNFLTLPKSLGTLAIFGGGYALGLLSNVPWLDAQPLYYWGDIDTHGFAILACLKACWPKAKSLLMDRSTLLDHRGVWSEEPLNGRCSQELLALSDDEAALYSDLRHNRLGIRVRLEQERINFEHVKALVDSL